MATSNDVVKQGYVKVKSKHLGVWKKRWLKLRRESGSGPIRIEKFCDEAMASIHGGERAITDLTQLLCLNRLHDDVKKHGIFVAVGVYPDVQKLEFCADSELEADNWMTALRQETTRAESADGKRNDIFWVYLMRAKQFDSHGECLLQVTSDALSLLDIENPKRVLVTWPLKAIRRYGVERGVFTIESGRSCPTGEGNFYFDARDAELIHRKVHEATQELANPQPKKVNNVTKENGVASPTYNTYGTPSTDYGSVRNNAQMNNTTRQKSIDKTKNNLDREPERAVASNDYYSAPLNPRKVSESTKSPTTKNPPGMSYEDVQYEQEKSDRLRGGIEVPVRRTSERSTGTIPADRPPTPPRFYAGMSQMRTESYAYPDDAYLLERRSEIDRIDKDSCYTATATYDEIKSVKSNQSIR